MNDDNSLTRAPHNLTVEEVVAGLRTDVRSGLAQSDARARLEQ